MKQSKPYDGVGVGIASLLALLVPRNDGLMQCGYHATPIRRGSSVITSRLVGVVI
ncbi:hypothetical protein QPP40_000791 [Campylobacter upsaliensis]|nr:hypothetical protein [Campylobacter upsaliensis]